MPVQTLLAESLPHYHGSVPTTVFISHDSRDHASAVIVQDLIQKTFKNVEAFVSGADLRGGDLWAESLRKKLDAACAIVALVSYSAADNAWVHFEAGAGFVSQKTIPLVPGGRKLSSLAGPFHLLQARPATARGLEDLLGDIARKCGQSHDLDDDDRRRIERTVDELGSVAQEAVASGRAIEPAAQQDLGGSLSADPTDDEFLERYERHVAEDPNYERALNFIDGGLEWRKRYERIKGLPAVELGVVRDRGVAWHISEHGQVFEVRGPNCPDDGTALRVRNIMGLDYPAEDSELIGPDMYTTLYCRDCREEYDLETSGTRSGGREIQRLGDCRADVLRKQLRGDLL